MDEDDLAEGLGFEGGVSPDRTTAEIAEDLGIDEDDWISWVREDPVKAARAAASAIGIAIGIPSDDWLVVWAVSEQLHLGRVEDAAGALDELEIDAQDAQLLMRVIMFPHEAYLVAEEAAARIIGIKISELRELDAEATRGDKLR